MERDFGAANEMKLYAGAARTGENLNIIHYTVESHCLRFLLIILGRRGSRNQYFCPKRGSIKKIFWPAGAKAYAVNGNIIQYNTTVLPYYRGPSW